ncbi:hypothetical protein AJ80_02258 [Polytolypa hystricis UAMH7299]|uniref:Uncharacterized protein n=1 Tax=Polytolypa hystricis (strain UAMH7299) TaxID=1447883 RepID=A0A2B7YS12_POLH7|nr:hypothetical protein AJ80_02258 [Polytolypa hystricis UAMH7299]
MTSMLQRPEISEEKQSIILDLLCRLLAPVGEWRADEISPSRGRRQKKLARRKAAKLRTTSSAQEQEDSNASAKQKSPRPPPPEIFPYLTLGAKSTTAHLDDSRSPPPSPQHTENPTPSRGDESRTLVVVFVCRATLPVSLYAHFPLLAKNASAGRPAGAEVRVVPVPKAAEARLAKAAYLPRLGIVGVCECRQAAPLIEYVREHVPLPKGIIAYGKGSGA